MMKQTWGPVLFRVLCRSSGIILNTVCFVNIMCHNVSAALRLQTGLCLQVRRSQLM